MTAPAPSLEHADIQGLLLHAYKHLDFAAYLTMSIAAPATCRKWLAAHLDQVTTAAGKSPHDGLNLAFTHAGLERLLPRGARWTGFNPEFAEGMVTPVRQRILGDHAGGPNDPEKWSWGGPANSPVHLLALVFAPTAKALQSRVLTLTRDAEASGLLVNPAILSHPLAAGREHFGFRDGIANPVVSTHPSHPNEVRAGEFVLGYENESGVTAPLPGLVGTPSSPAWGRNGSYLVFRQISQDVNGFWRALNQLAAPAGPAPDEATVIRLAAKMFGRWPNGAPLAQFPEPVPGELADRDTRLDRFGYREHDAKGLHCPFGAHVRRANPRDGQGDSAAVSIAGVNKHRLLRRGRAYGSPATDFRGPDEAVVASKYPGAIATEDRGLLFLAVVADLKAQFEFVQQTWLNSRKFPEATDSFDPIAGAPGRRPADQVTSFVVPACPVRERYTGLGSFIRTIGGAYFFMPGMAALRTLISIPPE